MGWSGGTDIARGIIKLAKDALPAEAKAKFYDRLIDLLTDHDWDCVDEAQGIDPVADKSIKKYLRRFE